MIYTTQFEITQEEVARSNNLESRIEYQKKISASELGNLIANKIGWETPIEGKEIAKHYLQVVAFPQKDWKDFKSKLFIAVDNMSELGLIDKNCAEIKNILFELETK